MGLYLIAESASALSELVDLIGVVVSVAIALGAVIFVHELGHFAVAKLCGVKCEKFYLGFDVYGLKLCKFQWGETEYGVGILPIGGYVKMLGQEDNPTRAAEELERARTAAASSESGDPASNATTVAASTGSGAEAESLGDGEAPEFDPRSYVAKSVPQRMAIISAGVVMNVIFAFICATIAYQLGVKYFPGGVGNVDPGSPAWKAGLHVGDEFVAVNGIDQPRMSDLQNAVVLGDSDDGVDLLVKRDGTDEPFSVTVVPEQGDIIPTIGLSLPMQPVLNETDPVRESYPASKAEEPFLGGDRIVRVADEPVDDYGDLHRILARHADDQLEFVVERAQKADADDEGATPTEEVSILVEANPMRRFGLLMTVGPIAAIQADSPAAAAGIQIGDVIQAVDGEPVADPIALPDQLRRRAGETVTLSLLGNTASAPRDVSVTLREVNGYEIASASHHPLAIPALGVVFHVENTVTGTIPGSPAAEANIAAGTKITRAEFIPHGDEGKEFEAQRSPAEIDLSGDDSPWPFVMTRLQWSHPDTTVKLTLAGGDNRVVELESMYSEDLNIPQRGIVPTPEILVRTASSFNEAVYLGGRETYESVTQVYQVIRRMSQRKVSPKALSGPLRIATYAGYSAYDGLPKLLTFLTLLSANLAVINFLPIPLLDGGHMVFLFWEGIRGKPANENVILLFHYFGFFAILGLMFWVLWLDIGWLVG